MIFTWLLALVRVALAVRYLVNPDPSWIWDERAWWPPSGRFHHPDRDGSPRRCW
jgi:hypothetical protein